MDYSTLLLEFMDGTLEGTDELALFNALSSNEELRAEFKHLLALSSSVRNDITPFLPPTSSTQHIFTQLGFTPPLPVPGTVAGVTTGAVAGTMAATAHAGKSAFFHLRRFFPTIASTVLASLTTAAMFMLWNGQDSAAPGALAHAPRTPSLERIVAHNMGAGTTQTGDVVAQSSAPVREVVRYVYIPRPAAQEATQNAALAVAPEPEEPVERMYDMPEPIRHTASLKEQFAASRISVADARPTHSIPAAPLSAGNWWDSSPEAFTVEMRDNVSLSFPSATVDPATSSWWNNKSLSLLYSLSEHQSVGIELGQEPFFQRFEARNDAGRRYQYEQTPVLQWAGVAYRFSISEIGVFNPFGQVVLGGTRVGYLGKTMVGINYTPNPSLRLTAGIEGSLLYYPVQGSVYRSGKLGFSYGIGFTF